MNDENISLGTLLNGADGLRFVLVGGVAAVIEGAPIATFDLDIVPDRDPRNINRLMAALGELKAHSRGRPTLRPTPDALQGSGYHLPMTRYGPLDVLGIIGKGRDFHALQPHARRCTLAGTRLHVLDLRTQIAVNNIGGGDVARNWRNCRCSFPPNPRYVRYDRLCHLLQTSIAYTG